jgi:hypothetical protein
MLRTPILNGVHALAWSDEFSSNKFKHAILSIFHCLELLLKERLRQENPALIWENIDKYPSMSANTVGAEKAISRLERICNLEISSEDKKSILACRNLRNAIQHFEFEIPEKEAKVVIGETLSFIFGFASKHLRIDLDEEFKNDDTWTLLIEQLYEFTQAHGKRMSEIMAEIGGPSDICHFCGQDTVDLIFERCRLCGAEHEPDKVW